MKIAAIHGDPNAASGMYVRSKLVTYTPGAFLYIPGRMAHFGGVKGMTVVQLHGQAAFKIELATPGSH